MQTPGFNIPAYKDSIKFTDYKLRVGDRIYVRIYSTDDKTNALFNAGGGSGMEQAMMGSGGASSDLYTYVVEDDGSIVFPMIGDVHLIGQTIREATTSLEKAIEPLFKFSSVELRVLNRSFSVIGNGNSAYITMPQEKINIFKALALAGDIGIFDDRSKIKILRETENGVQIKMFDVRSADIVHSEFYYIEPNDVIYIQPLNEQFFRISNLTGLVSTVVATFSFGVLIYDSAQRIAKTPSTN
ncbi:MAG: polysaccharide biosynthesis/export family protein [Paludibacter sp.]